MSAIITPPIAKVIPLGLYVIRKPDGSWDTQRFLTYEAIQDHLILTGELDLRFKRQKNDPGLGKDPLLKVIKPDGPTAKAGGSLLCTGVYGFECVPNGDPLVNVGGQLYVNTWARPSLIPTPGPYPRVRRVLEWLVDHDERGLEWLENWVAYKVQHPAEMPGTAVLFVGPQGSGKNAAYRMVAEILGPGNCAEISDADVLGQFNSHWASRLFVLADELLEDYDRSRSLNEKVKTLLTSRTHWIEQKNHPRLPITNRLAMWAATNKTQPIRLDPTDRRWSVFTNWTPCPRDSERYAFLSSLHVPNTNDEFTEEFKAEIAGWAHALLNRVVDYDMRKRPFDSPARRELLRLSETSAASFIREVEEHGLEDLLAAAQVRNFNMGTSRASWDFGAFLSANAIYQCYREFCQQNGTKASTAKHLGVALKNAGWPNDRVTAPNGDRVRCWKVPHRTASHAPTPRLQPAPSSTASVA